MSWGSISYMNIQFSRTPCWNHYSLLKYFGTFVKSTDHICMGPFMEHVHACYVASVVSNSLQAYGLQPAGLLCLWDSPGKNTKVGCHALLQGIFPTQWSNLRLLHCRRILYPEPSGKPLYGYFILLIYVPVLKPILYCHDDYGFIMNLEIKE